MRRIPAIAVVVALALLVYWIAGKTYWTDVPIAMPPKGEAATNPFYAAQRLAEELGARTQWRHDLPSAASSDSIIVLASWNWNLIPSRREWLEKWVASGGRLILDDSIVGGGRRLQEWTGIKVKVGGYLDPPRIYPWAWRRGGQVRVVRVAIGSGSVTQFSLQPYVTQELLLDDHAAMFVAGTQLHRGDQVYFLSDSEGASLLSLAWQQGAPVIVLILVSIGLAIWRAGARFGPRAFVPDPARRSLAEQIRGTGRFTVRFGGGRALHTAAVRALNEAAVRHIVHYAKLPSEERIATLGRMTGLAPAELSQALNYSGPRRQTDLRSAVAVLEFAQRTISASRPDKKTIQERLRHAG